jgi:hypothetical protein
MPPPAKADGASRTVSTSRDEYPEIVAEMTVDNPAPTEPWKKRSFWNPQFSLAAINQAEQAGVIETRGDRDTDEYEFRFTAYGRLVSQGHKPQHGVSDGLLALERLKANGDPNAALISGLVASLLGEVAALRSATSLPSSIQSADVAVTWCYWGSRRPGNPTSPQGTGSPNG